MAFFGVTIEKIKTSEHHKNADRLNVCVLDGKDFQFVTGRDEYKLGDSVLYIPTEAILPPELAQKLGLEGKLAGKDKNRVKTMRLRGELSQGIVAPLNLIPETLKTPEEITAFLGITKYEPPVMLTNDGVAISGLPLGIPHYDIEGADRYSEIANSLMDQPVYITEKLDGTNFSVTYDPEQDKVWVNTHAHTLLPLEGFENNHFWKTAKEQGVIEFAKRLAEGKHQVTIYGELIGPKIQGNIYKLKTFEVRLFDVFVDTYFLAPDDFLEACTKAGQPKVPCIGACVLKDWLKGKTIKEASNGKSVMRDGYREGIVIKPMTEQRHPKIGRLFLKQRSPDYMAKEE